MADDGEVEGRRSRRIPRKLAPWLLPYAEVLTREPHPEINLDKIDDAVLALLYLTTHDWCHAWKGFDWRAMDRLYEKGFIDDPKSKAKSVVFTEEGIARSRELFETLFAKR